MDSRIYRIRAKFHKALGNERRLAVLNFLKAHKTKQPSVVDLARHLKVPYKSLSKHLQLLEQMNFIERVRRGQTINYQVTSIAEKYLKLFSDQF